MTNPASLDAENPTSETPAQESQPAPKAETGRGEISAQTIARMMGITTQSDLKLIEGKLDLIVSRLGTISARLEKVGNIVQQAPTTNDMERIDVQIGTLTSSIKELVTAIKSSPGAAQTDQLNKAAAALDSVPEGYDKK